MEKQFVYKFGTLLDKIDLEQSHAVIIEALMEYSLSMMSQVI